MIRTQIQLKEEQLERLRSLARDRGVSISQLVREGIERVLAGSDRDLRWRKFWKAAGSCRDPQGETNVSAEHDRHLAEIWARGRRLR